MLQWKKIKILLYVKRLQQKDHKDIAPYLVNLSL
jgi:hypothetical protein